MLQQLLVTLLHVILQSSFCFAKCNTSFCALDLRFLQSGFCLCSSILKACFLGWLKLKLQKVLPAGFNCCVVFQLKFRKFVQQLLFSSSGSSQLCSTFCQLKTDWMLFYKTWAFLCWLDVVSQDLGFPLLIGCCFTRLGLSSVDWMLFYKTWAFLCWLGVVLQDLGFPLLIGCCFTRLGLSSVTWLLLGGNNILTVCWRTGCLHIQSRVSNNCWKWLTRWECTWIQEIIEFFFSLLADEQHLAEVFLCTFSISFFSFFSWMEIPVRWSHHWLMSL